jgi:nitrogen regulatory protein PII
MNRIFLTILEALVISCTVVMPLSAQRGGGGGSKKNYDDDIEEKYVTLPNGTIVTIVNERITEDVVDMIFKRFEAIENGDVAAFRSTLPEIQDGVDYHYQLGLIFNFFGDLFDIDFDVFEEAVATGEVLREIAETLFNCEPPLRSRNTGLLIKKLDVVAGLGLVVVTANNKNEEIIYNFLYW